MAPLGYLAAARNNGVKRKHSVVSLEKKLGIIAEKLLQIVLEWLSQQ